MNSEAGKWMDSARPSEADLVLGPVVEQALPTDRAAFLARTYTHLLIAILAFVALEALWFATPVATFVLQTLAAGRFMWLLFMGGFVVVSMLAEKWARSTTSRGTQYAGLALYTVFESILFLPLIFMALLAMSEPGGDATLLPRAAAVTGGLFALLSAVVFFTRRDFTFLRTVLIFGGLAALGLVVCATVFDFQLGTTFSYAMVALACCSILYNTSALQRRFRTSQHVAASLALFASVMLLFWYVLRIFLARRR
jgi:FtsH-binding integral membrane protein